jgi:hypothetical protein
MIEAPMSDATLEVDENHWPVRVILAGWGMMP